MLELIYLGSASNSTYVCIVDSNAPAKNFKQALQRPMIMGASAAGGPSRDSVLILINLLGAKFRLVDGYRDRAQVSGSMRTQGLCGYSWSRLKRQSFDLVIDNKVNLQLQLYDFTTAEPAVTGDRLEELMHCWQPVFVTNPDTARRALYVSRLMSARIEGMDETESRDVLPRCAISSKRRTIFMNVRGGPATSSCGIISLLCMPAMTGRRKNGVTCAAAAWKASSFTEFLLPLGYFNTKYERIDCNLT